MKKVVKRIMSFIAAMILVFNFTILAFADTSMGNGAFQDCHYSTYTDCGRYHYNSIMELQYCTNGADWRDYSFKINVRVFVPDSLTGDAPLGTIYGTAATNMATNYSEFERQLHHVVAFYYVNSIEDGDATVYV